MEARATIAAVALALATFSACREENEPWVAGLEVVDLVIVPTAFNFEPGGAYQLFALAEGSDGEWRDVSAPAAWATSSGEVLSIDANGFAVARSVGEATVTATYADLTAAAVFHVAQATVEVERCWVLPEELDLECDERAVLWVFSEWPDGRTFDVTEESLYWLGQTGVVTLVGASVEGQALGEVDVGASYYHLACAPCRVRVGCECGALGIQARETIVDPDGTTQISARCAWGGMERDVTAEVTWATSDSSIATISDEGELTALRAGGVTVTAVHESSGGTRIESNELWIAVRGS